MKLTKSKDMEKYDWLIVGSGLFGATFANLAKKDGKRCLVIDKRKHIGGNLYCETRNSIIVHKYGAHIFHTSNKEIWDFVNTYCDFTPYCHQPIANYNGELYNLPFNLNTFYRIWGAKKPNDIESIIKSKIKHIENIKNLEEQALSLVGNDVYYRLIKGYTEKQWGKDCKDLPPSIIKRIPIRLTFDNNYFDDVYQGIPNGGYNNLIEGLLKGIEKKNANFIEDKEYFLSIANKVLYTGQIDELFDYNLGTLEYRTIRLEEEELGVPNFQGCSVMNYTSTKEPYTRIIEHKHFDKWCKNKTTTIISKEYSEAWGKGKEPYYPINDFKNVSLHKEYLELSKRIYGDKIVFGGRLGNYKYYDMDDAIENAISLYRQSLLNQ